MFSACLVSSDTVKKDFCRNYLREWWVLEMERMTCFLSACFDLWVPLLLTQSGLVNYLGVTIFSVDIFRKHITSLMKRCPMKALKKKTKTDKHVGFHKDSQLRNTTLLTAEFVTQVLLRKCSWAGYILTPKLAEQLCYLFSRAQGW